MLSDGKPGDAGNKGIVKRSREVKALPGGDSRRQGGEALALGLETQGDPCMRDRREGGVTRRSLVSQPLIPGSSDPDSWPLRVTLCQHLPPYSTGSWHLPAFARCFSTTGLCPPRPMPHTLMVTPTHFCFFLFLSA